MLVLQSDFLGVIMTLPRRKFLHLAAGATALPVVSRMARAQPYPTRPVRIIVGFAAGGNADILARLMGQWLSERLGQPFIVENKPGAATNIANEMVAKAAPDGYPLLLISTANLVNAMSYEKRNFDFNRDITPVASIARGTYVMVINPSVPAKHVTEFIAYAKANPGKISMASAGTGSPPHVMGELFEAMAGIDMIHVPYRGGDAPALTDLIGGHVQVYFGSMPSSIEHIKTGKLRALAVTTTERSNALPDIPTMSEFVPGYEASLWNGLASPKATPVEIIDRVNSEINAGLSDQTIKTRLADLGATAYARTPAQFGRFVTSEAEKWAKVIRAANIKAE